MEFKKYKKNIWIFRITIIFIILTLTILTNVYLIPDRQIPANDIPIIYKNGAPYADFNSLKSNITQQIQESINSGNLMESFWKMIYLGHGLDKLCYEITNNPDKMAILINDSSGESYEIKNKKCFDSSKSIPDLSYELTLAIPSNISNNLVNKSECVYFLNESVPCIVNGEKRVCSSCLTKTIDFIYQTPKIKRYFEAKNFYKGIKFFLIFILMGIICWNVSRIYVLIKDGIK